MGDILPKDFPPWKTVYTQYRRWEKQNSFEEANHQLIKRVRINSVIVPTAIYHRHPGVYKDYPYYDKHIAFFEVLDVWQGNLIGQKRDHYHNSSKAYQGITSIQGATKRVGE